MANWNVRLFPERITQEQRDTGVKQDYLRIMVEGQELEMFGKYAIVRDNPVHVGQVDALAISGSKYEPVQNEQVFSFGETILAQAPDATWETAGSIKGGRVVFGSVKLGKSVLINGQDLVEHYLVVTSTHDTSGGVNVFITPVRPVCENTLRMAISMAATSFKAKHTASIDGRISDAQKALGITYRFIEEFEATAHILADRTVDNSKLEEIYESVWSKPDIDPDNIKVGESTTGLTGWGNRLEDVMTIFDGKAETGVDMSRSKALYAGDTMRGISGTAWGSVNAMTEFVDWYGYKTGRLERAAGFNANNEVLKTRILKNTLNLTGGIPTYEWSGDKLTVAVEA
jgi:phage/plasmid-like protein (TIGR03299 family)